MKKSREKEKERDRKKEQDREKDSTKDRDSRKKDYDGKTKDKSRSNDKDRDHKRERDSDKKTERSKTQSSDKQSASMSEVKTKNSIKESTIKRSHPTKLKKNEKSSKESSRSNSESKTPTSPPIINVKTPISEVMSPPKTPPNPPEEHVAAEESGKDGTCATEEKIDTQLVLPDTNQQMKQKNKLDSDVEKDEHPTDSHGVPETPESPPLHPSDKKQQKLESDLSSGEEFPEDGPGSPSLSPHSAFKEKGKKEKVERPVEKRMVEVKSSLKQEEVEPVKFKMTLTSHTRKPSSSGVVSPHTARWSPDPLPSQSHRFSPSRSHHSPHTTYHTDTGHHSPLPTSASTHHSGGEESEEGFRKKKLPRCYQLEEERMREKQREVKEHRHIKPHPPPTTPSPPPAYASHRRRPPYSPPPSEYGDRRWRQRGRHYSPGHQFGTQHYSRSPPPPGYPQSPPLTRGGGSPYSGSPPPRPRTPIQRPRDRGGHRHRYESPPHDMPRGKYSRHASSPLRHMSPSPPLSRPRSPIPSRRHVRRYSRSPSPPRRSPPRRKERTPSPGSSRSSYSEDRLEARKYAKKPPPVYSRSPSPKPKRRDGAPPRDDYPDAKRRRMDEGQINSPAGGPHVVKDEQLKSSKSQQMPYQSSSTSDRHTPHHTVSGKESQQRYQQGSTLGSGAHGNHASRSTHAVGQGKMSTSPLVAPHSTGISGAVSMQTPPSQQPTDNLMDLLR